MFVESLSSNHLLSITLFLPILGCLIALFIPREQESSHRFNALVISTITFVVSLLLLDGFNGNSGGFQHVERYHWLPFGVTFFVGVDGISLWLVLLTTFLTPVTILSTFSAIKERVKEFYIAMLLLETGMTGALVAIDLFLFYIFWEFMLIPMYLLIGVWGGERRIYSAVKFFLFTLFGSVLMLVALIYIYIKTGSSEFNFIEVVKLDFTMREQLWLFAAFALSFAIKVPIFPFHTWLPDAHTEAPTAGSVILAGILLKMGTYGFLRFAIPMFPSAAGYFSLPIMILAVIGIVYGALMAYAQVDVKRLVAYSSVSHLGFVMLGMFAFNEEGISGSILQMINHGVSTGALFLIVGIIYERRHTRLIGEFGGLANNMKLFATVFVIITLSSIGLPGTNGFVGEFLILTGTFREALASSGAERTYMILLGIFAASGIILGAVYMLTMLRRVIFGKITNPKNEGLKDLNPRETLVLIPLVLLVFLIGILPNIFLKKIEGSVNLAIAQNKETVSKVRMQWTDSGVSGLFKGNE